MCFISPDYGIAVTCWQQKNFHFVFVFFPCNFATLNVVVIVVVVYESHIFIMETITRFNLLCLCFLLLLYIKEVESNSKPANCCRIRLKCVNNVWYKGVDRMEECRIWKLSACTQITFTCLKCFRCVYWLWRAMRLAQVLAIDC